MRYAQENDVSVIVLGNRGMTSMQALALAVYPTAWRTMHPVPFWLYGDSPGDAYADQARRKVK